MTYRADVEIREPQLDHPFTLIVRPFGDETPENWRELEGCTLSPPDTAPFGFELRVQERIDWPEGVICQVVYIPETAPPAEDFLGRVPGRALSAIKWTTVGNYEVRCVPRIAHERVNWLKPITPEQQAWVKLQEKLRGFCEKHPELELAGRTAAGSLIDRLHDRLEARFGIQHCGKCLHWDAEEGQKEFTKVTHRFDGGDIGQMNIDIAAMCANERHVRTLIPDKVGFCTVRQMLIEEDFQACPKFEAAP